MMKEVEKDFDLLNNRWILVLNAKGEVEEISLLEFFRRAHELKSLAGELVTQDVAMLRLLLAIVYAVFTKFDANGNPSPLKNISDALKRWEQIWQLRQFPLGAIEKYLKKYEERFYLFHPERPFYQVPALDKGTPYSAAKLMGDLSESSNKVRLFALKTGRGKKHVGKAEAARWLLHLNAFDDTSSKPSTRGAGLPSIGAGWLGKLGLVFAVGANMFETLLLNFVLADEKQTVFSNGKTTWEQDKINKAERVKISVPDSMPELLTLQSRRVLLEKTADGEYVSGYKLLGGDGFEKDNAVIEQMTLWNTKVNGNLTVFSPKRHDPARFLWRDFPALVANSQDFRKPGVVRWVGILKNQKLIGNKLASFQTASIKYGDKDFFIDDVFSDSITLNADLLTELGGEYVGRIVGLLDKTDKCVKALGYLAANIAAAAGGSEVQNISGVSEEAREQAYFSLDKPFRNWLAGVDPEKDDLDDIAAEWLQKMSRIVTKQGEQIVAQAGEKAFVGRYKEIKGKRVAQTAAKAFSSFKMAIKNTING
ncbi:MAG: type I-E CRISPR-associated protein Cse1/CasA [Acidaminococcales bacterium]|jgi:CRISPR system Cascade subunit CasA|nr:type I-E CRISPR-associated protein Cse1/CasA [Acidaminococcales bacterium]